MRRVQYKWLRKTWTMDLHDLGDPVCDSFQPPNAISLIPWLLADNSGTFVDAGAHVGTIAVHAALFFKQVVAFEPEARNLECLKTNIAQNRLPNIHILPCAVSDQCGASTFYIADSVDTARNSLIPKTGGSSVEVQTVTIDSIFSNQLANHPPVSFLKIDVEGFEPQVIKGASSTISKLARKPVIEVEFAPSRWQRNESDFNWLCEFLRNNDYIPFLPTSGFLSPITVDLFAQIYNCWKGLKYESWVDLLLVPSVQSSSDHIIMAYKHSVSIFSKIK
jgi:FkbM family methyltransferase